MFWNSLVELAWRSFGLPSLQDIRSDATHTSIGMSPAGGRPNSVDKSAGAVSTPTVRDSDACVRQTAATVYLHYQLTLSHYAGRYKWAS